MNIAIIMKTRGGISGGNRKYLFNIIPRMAIHPDVETILFASPDSLDIRNLFKSIENVEFINCLPYRFINLDPELNKNLKKFSPDVIFLPIERYFRFNDIPFVNMVRNMEPLILPFGNNSFKQKIKNLARQKITKYSLKKSQRIIAVSGFARDFLVKYWNIPKEKISLIYHGIDPPRNKIGQKPKAIPKKWHNKFIFTAGSIRVARGLEDIFYALKYLSDSPWDMMGLVVAGNHNIENKTYQKKLMDMACQFGMSQKIYWTGYLSDEEMAWCYQNCQMFVMTSRVEACPNIALEAMAHGCVCIFANNPPLPEIFGDVALYYLPKNGKALAEAIKTVLSWNNHQRNNMSKCARRRASQFSWDLCVEKIIEELKKSIEPSNIESRNQNLKNEGIFK